MIIHHWYGALIRTRYSIDLSSESIHQLLRWVIKTTVNQTTNTLISPNKATEVKLGDSSESKSGYFILLTVMLIFCSLAW